MSGKEDSYRIGFWENEWSEDRAFWHIEEVNPILKKYEDKLVPSSEAGNETTIFFPLCGKTVDMLYFLEKGYNVIGVEGVETVILEYFKENRIKYEIISVKHSGSELKLFVAGKLTIICGNYFITEPLKPGSGIPEYITRKVDAVFDRGSMMAILPSLLTDYVKILGKWVKASGKLLLYAPEFDQSLRAGPPYSLSDSKINEVYNGIANTEILETNIGKLFELEDVKHRNWLITF